MSAIIEIFLLISISSLAVLAQVTPTTTADPSSPPLPPNSTACSWEDNSLTDYLKCQKDKVSSTTLIATGIGVTVGVLLLVGLGVWLCSRQRNSRLPKRSAQAMETGGDDEETESVEDKPSSIRKIRHISDEEGNSPNKSSHSKKPAPGLRAKVESMSSGSEWNVTPPPPHPAHANLTSSKRGQPQLPSQVLNFGSPINQGMNVGRTLYPSNPSPNPRHLTHSAHRPASTISKRQSMFGSNTPPVPVPIRSGTRPLTIRKSTLQAPVPIRGQDLPSIPSYYEATKGQLSLEGVPTKSLHTPPGPGLGDQGRSTSASDGPPPVPLAQRPDHRRPSAPLRRATERGGMI